MDALEKELWDAFEKKPVRNINEWTTPRTDQIDSDFSDSVDELGEICSDMTFASGRMKELLHDFNDSYWEGESFFGERILAEYYQELEKLCQQLLAKKQVIEKIVSMGNSSTDEDEIIK